MGEIRETQKEDGDVYFSDTELNKPPEMFFLFTVNGRGALRGRGGWFGN